jgi:hypothetical protein
LNIDQQDFPAEFAAPARRVLLACQPYLPPEILRVIFCYQAIVDGDEEVAATVDTAWEYHETRITLSARFFNPGFSDDDRLEMLLHEITHVHNTPHDGLVWKRMLPRVPTAVRGLLEELISGADEYRVQGIARGIVRLLRAVREKDNSEKEKADE